MNIDHNALTQLLHKCCDSPLDVPNPRFSLVYFSHQAEWIPTSKPYILQLFSTLHKVAFSSVACYFRSSSYAPTVKVVSLNSFGKLNRGMARCKAKNGNTWTADWLIKVDPLWKCQYLRVYKRSIVCFCVPTELLSVCTLTFRTDNDTHLYCLWFESMLFTFYSGSTRRTQVWPHPMSTKVV